MRGRTLAMLAGAAVVVGAALLSWWLTAPKPPPNVVVVLIDTLRADALGTYGRSPSPSKRLDALAAEGMVFENAYAPSPWTRSSVAALFTSRLPSHLGILSEDTSHALDARFFTVAKYFESLGYDTGAFVANGHLQQLSMDQFDTHHVNPGETADTLTERALNWLEGRDAPFFLYLHYLDPHYPHRHHSETGFGVEREFTAQPRPGRVLRECGMLPVADDVRRDLWANYLSEVAFTDGQLGRVLDELEPKWDDTLLVVTRDHGEMFGEHGQWEHGCSLHRDLLQVPLIFAGGRVPRSGRVTSMARLIDVLPTFMEVLTPEALDGAPLSGRSLLPELSGAAGPAATMSVASNGFRQPVAHSITDGAHQLWRMPDGEQLWNMQGDGPLDLNTNAQAGSALRTALDEALAIPEGWPAAPRENRKPNVELDEQTREAQRAMGYVADPR
jgi:arylsulfatase A-like enzyme